MLSENRDHTQRLPRIIARFHASELIITALLALTMATLGRQGWGPFNILAAQPWGYIGLYQAYVLMLFIATIAWIGSLRWDTRLWNVLLMLAEMVPISILFIAAPVFAATGEQNTALLAMAIHIPMALLEGVALLWKAPWPVRHRNAHNVDRLPSN